jgi:uncharacterized membrane protein YciS (DUF1049 family)
MKKLKIILWVIIVAFIALVFFQNRDFFISKQGLILNLYFTNAYQSPKLPLIVWFLATLMIGFLISYLFGLTERFKLKKVIKGLKAKTDTQMEMITKIRSELESRTGPLPVETPSAPADSLEIRPEQRDAQVSSDD